MGMKNTYSNSLTKTHLLICCFIYLGNGIFNNIDLNYYYYYYYYLLPKFQHKYNFSVEYLLTIIQVNFVSGLFFKL